VMVLQSSADPDIYKPGGTKERKGIVFIGNNFLNTNHQFPLSKERVDMVEFLKKEFPNDFKVYGNNWGDSHITVFKDDKNEEVDLYQSALISVNHNNFNHTSYTSDRLWRSVFSGSLCITKYFKGVEKLFDMYNQVECWNTLGELKRLIEHYLSHPESAIRNASGAREHALANHTWSSRVKEMMAFIQDNLMDMRVWEFPIVDGCTTAGAHAIGGIIPGLNGDDDAKYKDVLCDCKKLRGDWYKCECGSQQYQFRWVENI
jgi:spore maturation protein CgeB